MRALRPYFIQGRGGDDSYDPSVATAIVLGPSAQIVAFDMKMRDGMGVEPLCVCVLGGCGRLRQTQRREWFQLVVVVLVGGSFVSASRVYTLLFGASVTLVSYKTA